MGSPAARPAARTSLLALPSPSAQARGRGRPASERKSPLFPLQMFSLESAFSRARRP